jgi:hypothetical protein
MTEKNTHLFHPTVFLVTDFYNFKGISHAFLFFFKFLIMEVSQFMKQTFSDFDGMDERMDAIKKFYRENAPLATMDLADAEPILRANARALKQKYADEIYMRTVIDATAEKVRSLILYNERVRNGKI